MDTDGNGVVNNLDYKVYCLLGDGEMQEHLDVYQRTGLPCHRCGRPVRRFELNARGTHYCSWCQRLPTADRTPSNAALVRTSRRTARRGR